MSLRVLAKVRNLIRGDRTPRPPPPKTTATSIVGEIFRETGLAMDQMGLEIMDSYAHRDTLNRHRRLMPFRGTRPEVGQGAWIAPNASIIGRVTLGSHTSTWYGSIIRGDQYPISIGKLGVVGERSIIRASEAETKLGDGVLIGDGAVLNSCTIGNDVRVDANSVVMEGATLGSSAMIGPSSVVEKGTHIPESEFWQGNPAKFVRKVTQEDIKQLQDQVDHMQQMAIQHDNELVKDAKQLSEDLAQYNEDFQPKRIKHDQVKYDF